MCKSLATDCKFVQDLMCTGLRARQTGIGAHPCAALAERLVTGDDWSNPFPRMEHASA